jgi:WD40 repeat protein
VVGARLRTVTAMQVGEGIAADLAAERVLELDGPVRAVALAPDEDTLVLECEGELLVVDPGTLTVRGRWRGERARVRRMEFSPDGTLLATAGYTGAVTLWDVAAGEPVRTFEGHEGRVWAVSFSRDATLLASAGDDHTVRLWSTAGGDPRVLHGHGAPVRSVAVSPDGRRVASGDEDHELHVWDVAGGRLERRLPGHTGKVRCVRFLPDGSLLSGGSDGTLRSWDAGTGSQLRLLQAHGEGRVGKIRTLALSADHRFLVTGAQDRTARVWSHPGWRLLATLHGHDDVVTSTAVSVRHGWVVTAGDHTLRRWPLPVG